MRNKCNGEAGYSIKAIIPIKGFEFYENTPVEYYCGLRLCAPCASLIRPQDIFNGEMQHAVCQVLRADGNPHLPDFERAKLIIISSNDLCLLQIEAQHATIH